MQPCTIRDAVEADLPQLLDIYNHYVVNTPITFDLEPVSLDVRREWLRQFAPQGRHRLLVCEQGGALLGYACSHQFRVKRAYDTSVEVTAYCAPSATGRGFGARMYAALFDALQGEDVRAYVAGITVPNAASIALHQRFGFVHIGTLRDVGRKFGKYWDVAWYQRLAGIE